MSPAIATFAYAIGIMGLFVFDRDRKARTSKALWIPVAWLLIAASRAVSEWLGMSPLEYSPDQYLDGSPLDRLVLSGLLAAGLIVLVMRGRQVGRLLRRNGPILLYFCYCALSVLWSEYPFVAFKRWTKAVGDLVMVLVVLTDFDRPAAVKRLLARTTFLLVPLSILFIKYYPGMGRAYSFWEGQVSWTGVTTNKNTLGMTCLILGLGSLWRFLVAYRSREGTDRTRRLIVHGTLLAMVLWLFWMADSVTSFACFLLGTGLMVATSLRALARRPGVVHLLVAATVTVCFFAVFVDAGGDLVASLGRDQTLTGRTAIWSLVLSLRGNPLVGTGFESFWLGERLQKMWALYWWHPNQAHNGYLEVFLNLGWIGVTLLGVLMVTGYRNVIVVFRRDPDAGQLRLAYFVVGVVYNFTEAGFRMMTPVWILLLLATAVVPELPSPKVQTSDDKVRLDQPCADLLAARTHIYEGSI
jgi:exopolysaccharide production protein ExoQ